MKEHIVKFFDMLVEASYQFFEPHHHYKIPRGTPSAVALNTGAG